jgi:hypothetical protein
MLEKKFEIGARVLYLIENKIYEIKEMTYSKVVLVNVEKGAKLTIGLSALPLFFKLIN